MKVILRIAHNKICATFLLFLNHFLLITVKVLTFALMVSFSKLGFSLAITNSAYIWTRLKIVCVYVCI